MSDDEIATCWQCGWPMRRTDMWVVVIDACDECGENHEVGVAHMDVCASDVARGETRITTQQRKRGKAGMN